MILVMPPETNLGPPTLLANEHWKRVGVGGGRIVFTPHLVTFHISYLFSLFYVLGQSRDCIASFMFVIFI